MGGRMGPMAGGFAGHPHPLLGLLFLIVWGGVNFFIVYEAVYLALKRAMREGWGKPPQ